MSSINLRGALFMALAMGFFSINDALTKLALGGISPAQAMAVRSLFAALLLFVIVWRQGQLANMHRALHPLVGLRIVGEIGGTITYVTALSHLPMANASAIFQALPIAVAVGAVVVFGERLGWRGYAAALLGFAGVLVITRPGLGFFDSGTIWPVLTVVFCTVRDLATAPIPASIGTSVISACTTASLFACGALLIPLYGGWSAMAARQTLLLGGAAVSVVAGFLLLIASLRSGATGLVSMFRYSYLLFSVVLGVAIFGDTLDGPTIAGMLLIAGSGAFLIRQKKPA